MLAFYWHLLVFLFPYFTIPGIFVSKFSDGTIYRDFLPFLNLLNLHASHSLQLSFMAFILRHFTSSFLTRPSYSASLHFAFLCISALRQLVSYANLSPPPLPQVTLMGVPYLSCDFFLVKNLASIQHKLGIWGGEI